MKLSTAIIAGVAAIGALGAAGASAAATVFEQYGYGLPVPDTDGAYLFVESSTALLDVTISGGYGNGNSDLGPVAAGGRTGYYYLGDSEDTTPGSQGTALVTITTDSGHVYSGNFTDVLGDLDASDAPVSLGNLGVPEPSTWALMLLGFGGLGATIRSSRRKTGVTA